ncbi:hypothetical protein TcasGA2_TC010259 [Tribolium castaneum]|uniref:Uncharacterized protein n=1 Tax=Tribolium castaneum TaxID=7070 RepID=D7EJB3_TRICA|nr:hypothetical protein TcasGA2_TC010259 [Tribolium castaneum]
MAKFVEAQDELEAKMKKVLTKCHIRGNRAANEDIKSYYFELVSLQQEIDPNMSDESFIAQFEDGLLPSLAETFYMFSNPNMSGQDLKDLVFRISGIKIKTFFNNLASESAFFFASNQERGRSWVSNGARAKETTQQKKEQSRLLHTRTRDGRPKCFNSNQAILRQRVVRGKQKR